jgi:hypothetical protein
MNIANLKSVSAEDLRRGFLEALAQLRETEHQPRLIPYNTLVNRVAAVLNRSPQFAAIQGKQNEFAFETTNGPNDEHYDNAVLLSAVWQLVATGVLIPRLQPTSHTRVNGGFPMTEITHVSVTPTGDELVRSLGKHPRFPGAIESLVSRHPGLKDEVAPRLDDAAKCIDQGLPRPAIVMIGLAMERTLENAEEVLTKAGKWPSKSASQMDRIGKMTVIVGQHYAKPNETKHRLTCALAIAEQVRVKRNAAAHDATEAFAVAEADQLLLAAVGAVEAIEALVV